MERMIEEVEILKKEIKIENTHRTLKDLTATMVEKTEVPDRLPETMVTREALDKG